MVQNLLLDWRLVMKILVLEDNERLNSLIKDALEKEGYRVDTFVDGEDALDSLAKGYQCFILDINVPSLDGISILESIRTYYSDIPVIIISSNHELDKIQTSYEIGCDDYLKKPFHIYELIQKVKRLCNFKSTILDLGEGYTFDIINRYLFKDTQKVDLTRKEILLLELLAKDTPRVFSFEEIEEYVWEGKLTTLNNIRALIKRIRKKIPEDSIQIVKGIGYCINKSCKVK